MNRELYYRILSSLILIPITFYVTLQGSLEFIFFLLICFSLSLYEWFKLCKIKSSKILGVLFLIFSFYTIFDLRSSSDNGYLIIFFVLIICVSTDLGGYLFGKIFKGPKLSKLSPNKTYSGVIGSYILSLLFFLIFTNYLYLQITIQNNSNIFIYVILLSTVSQLGDLTISYFKRKSKIKDTGKIIPGHGGILDRIDGIIFTFPFFYFLYYFKIITFIQ